MSHKLFVLAGLLFGAGFHPVIVRAAEPILVVDYSPGKAGQSNPAEAEWSKMDAATRLQKLPGLIDTVRSGNWHEPILALAILAKDPSIQPTMIPMLISLLKSDQAIVRASGRSLLIAAAPAAIGSLEVALGDADAGLRREAAFTISGLPDMKPLIPALLGRLHDPEPRVRGPVAFALMRSQEGRDALVQSEGKDAQITIEAPAEQVTLPSLSPQNAADDNLQKLRSPDRMIRARAAQFYAEQPELHSEALADLKDLFKDAEPNVRAQALRAVAHIQTDRQDLPDYIQLLSDPDVDVRLLAARTIASLGSDAAPAVSALVDFAHRYSKAPQARAEAESALRRIATPEAMLNANQLHEEQEAPTAPESHLPYLGIALGIIVTLIFARLLMHFLRKT